MPITRPSQGLPVPPEPVVFSKWTSALMGPDDRDARFREARSRPIGRLNWPLSSGWAGATLTKPMPCAHVAGYCVMNDVSERDFQLNRSGTWDKGKGCDSFGPLGPWLVTADEVPDPQALRLWLEVDGKRYQNGSTATMVYGVPFLIQLPEPAS
jgi:2,4-diketo-3-deoxy-L-fuconate hydrolase